MPNIGELFVRLRADTSDFQQGMSQAQAITGTFRAVIAENLGQIGQQVGEMGRNIVSSIGGIVSTASKWTAEIQQQKFVYGNLEPVVQKAIDNNKGMAEGLGMTKQQYMNNTTAISDFLQRMGLTGTEIAKQSGKVTQLTADMAAFADVPVDVATDDFKSALVGNFNALDKYGVTVNVATINQGKYAKELGKSWEKMTQAEKAQAILSETMTQASSFTGLAQQEAGGFTMQMNLMKQRLMETASAVGEKLFPVLEPLISKISEGAKKIADWANEHPKLTQGILMVVGGIGVLMAIVGPLMSTFAAVSTIMIATELTFTGLVLPIVAIVGVIAGLIAIGVALWQNWDTISSKCSEVWNSVVDSISSAYNNVVQWLSSMIDSVVEWATNLYNSSVEAGINFFNGIVQWFSQLPQTISAWLTTTMTNIATWCSETWNIFITWCTNIITSVSEWFSQLPSMMGYAFGFALGTIASWGINTWNYLATNVPLWINGIANFFSQLPGKIWTWLVNTYNNIVSWSSQMISKGIDTGMQFINSVVNYISQLPGRVWSFLQLCINRAQNWATQMKQKATEAGTAFINRIVNYISQLPGRVWSWLVNTISRVTGFVSQMGSKARSAASQFTSNLINGIKTIPSKVASIGRDIVKGIWNGIKGAGGWLKGKIGEFGSGVVNGFKNAFKIQSPSRLMRDEIGKFLPEGIAVGIKANAKSVYNSLDDLASTSVSMSSEGFRNAVAKSNNINANEVNRSNFAIDYDMMTNSFIKAFSSMDFGFNVDGRQLGKVTAKHFDEELEILKNRKNRKNGGT